MGLYLTSTDSVGYRSAAIIDDLTTFTFMAWVTFDSFPAGGGTTEMLVQKDPMNFFIYNDGAGAILNMEVARATTVLVVAGFMSNFAFGRAGLPIFIAARVDTGGASGDQQLLIGTRRHPVAPPSSYSSQQVGSGTPVSNAANNMTFGNEGGGTNPLNGVADLFIASRNYLTMPEINSVREATGKGYLPPVRGAVIYTPFGKNLSVQPDLTSFGNYGDLTGGRVDQRAGQRFMPRIVRMARGKTPPTDVGPLLGGRLLRGGKLLRGRLVG